MISGSIANQQNVRMPVPVMAWAGVGVSLIVGFALTYWDFAYAGVAVAAIGSALAMMSAPHSAKASDEPAVQATSTNISSAELGQIDGLTNELAGIIGTCESNLNDVMATQDSAITTLSTSFTTLRSMVAEQNECIAHLIHTDSDNLSLIHI